MKIEREMRGRMKRRGGEAAAEKGQQHKFIEYFARNFFVG